MGQLRVWVIYIVLPKFFMPYLIELGKHLSITLASLVFTWTRTSSAAEEQEFLTVVDSRTCRRLAKRRFQHYCYEFLYETRNVDSKLILDEFPPFVSKILNKIVIVPGVKNCTTKLFDQLTVNEYPCGVGLSLHIGTHSPFKEIIISLSLAHLARPFIMKFRQCPKGSWYAPSMVNGTDEASIQHPQYIRKSVFLPPRSMLLTSGEGRYAWHHYKPHHKVLTERTISLIGISTRCQTRRIGENDVISFSTSGSCRYRVACSSSVLIQFLDL